MKKLIFFIALIFLFPLFWNGKSYSKYEGTCALIDTNLIYNSSFEFDTIPSDTLWIFTYPNKITKVAPTGGGQWSAGLIPNDDSANLDNAEYHVTGISGTNNYTLKATWIVAQRNPYFIQGNGSVTAGVLSATGQLLQSHTMTISNADSSWTNDSISFSLTTYSSDVIVVRLCGGTTATNSHPWADGLFYFDLVQLVKH